MARINHNSIAAVAAVLLVAILASGCVNTPPAPAPEVPLDWVQIKAGEAFTIMAPQGTSSHLGGGDDSYVGAIAWEPPGPQFFLTFDYGPFGYDILGPDTPPISVERFRVGTWLYSLATYPEKEGCPIGMGLKVDPAPEYGSKAAGSDYLVISGCAHSAEEQGALRDMLKSVRMLKKAGSSRY